MNQSNHLLTGIASNVASRKHTADGFDSQFHELVSWANIFFHSSAQSICILKPDSLDLLYLNPALKELIGDNYDSVPGSLVELIGANAELSLKGLLASDTTDLITICPVLIAGKQNEDYEIKVTRHHAAPAFISAEFSLCAGHKADAIQPGAQEATAINVAQKVKGSVTTPIVTEENAAVVFNGADALSGVVSSLDDVVFEYDTEGNFKQMWCNNQFVLQRIPADYVGKSMREAYQSNPTLTGPFIEDFENAISNNEICYRDFQLSGHDEIRWFNSKITPIYYPDGNPKGFSQRITDISEQKKVDLAVSEKNDELRVAHRELKEIIENTSEIIFKLDQDNRIIFVSPEFQRALGFPGSDFVDQAIEAIIHKDDKKRFADELRDAKVISGGSINNIYRVSVKDGIERWFSITAKFLGNTGDESFTGLVFAKDITELKQTMDSLVASEERYRSVVESLSEGIVMHNSEGHVVACNHAAEKMFQLDKGEGLGDVIRQPDLRIVKENGSFFQLMEIPAMVTLTTGKAVRNVTMGVYKKNGEITWLTINTEPVFYTSNTTKPDAIVASMIDITEQKIARELLSENTARIKEYSEKITGILDSITDGFIAINSDMAVTLWNRVIETITGISNQYAVGKNLSALNSYMADLLSIERYEHALLHKTAVTFEQYVPALDNWYETSAYPFGEGLFIYFRDITSRKTQENLLALEKRVLEFNASQVAGLKETVDHFLEGLEEIFPGMLCSVLILDEDGVSMRHLSAPSLPPSFTDLIDGVHIGPAVGSCGTAMYTRNRVIVSDINSDHLWAAYRELAAAHDLNACWSFPIKNAQNEVLATIATYYRHASTPSEIQLQILERVQNLLKVIIENKKADSRIRISNERYLLATKATNDAIWDYNVVSDALYHGEGYASIFGHRITRLAEPLTNWTSKIHEDDRERVTRSFADFIKSGTHKYWETEYQYLKADGSYALVCDRGFLIFNQKGQVARIVGSMQDITERKQLEKQVLKQELDRQKLVAQAVVDAQEKERAEIGKELHDNVNQILSTAKLYLELAKSDEKERLILISRSIENIFDAINEIRAISRSLVPPSIGDLGIIESINDLMENVRATRKLNAEFYYTAGIENLINEKQQLMLFRIIQEQVNNVLKHAEATNLIIELMVDADIVDLTISDNGKGFDKENHKLKRGVGLSNIASRTELFNGKINLITAPGKGCTLNIHIPITNE